MAVATSTDITPESPLPTRGTGRRRWGIALVLILAALWSVSGLDVSFSRLVGAPGEAWAVLRQMVPPAFGRVYERGAVGKIFESVYIAWIGTLIGATLSLPLAFLAANNVSPRWVRTPVRQFFNAIRAVPELILAVIFIPITGLGPWAGALAIGIHSIGTLGKWATESIEGIDSGPIEAVKATGGQWVNRMRWAVIPQVMATITSYWLFRFEINVRASAVLGMIGAGGVGSELVSHLIFRDFPAASAVLILTVVVVLTIDTVSANVRRRIIVGSVGDRDSSRWSETWADLTGLRRSTK